jgi:predicted acylesterase/phospholipase RssA/CRP-like cAMP-binding protein
VTRLDARLAGALGSLFGEAGDAFLDEVGDATTVSELRGGDVLFREGEPGDAAYVVLAGRLRAVSGPPDDERVLSDAARGETAGELALLTGQPRSATVFAVRDSVVARIPTAEFEQLLRRHPAAVLPITRLLADRLRRVTAAPVIRPPATVTIAVFGAGSADATRFAAGLADAIGPMLPVALVGSSSPASADLDTAESSAAAVVFVGESGWTPWNDRILRYADEVLLLVDADADPGPGAVEAGLFTPRARGGQRVTLVLLQRAAYPTATARHLAGRPVSAHLHAVAEDTADLPRVARWVTGRSVALVLGGGGARGWAHLGAARALREAGVPIDLIGGTSHGALVGAALADRHEPDEIETVALGYVKRIKDVTLPLVSILRGGHILRGIRRVARRGADVEDLWLPFFTVATNLSTAGVEILDRGPLDAAIRASVSLPLILPPIVRDGELLVDGGLLDNLPIGPMRRRMPTGAIVAVDPSTREVVTHYDDLAPDVSGWRVLLDRLLGRRRRIPTLGDVALRTVVVGSIHLRRDRPADPDLLLLAPRLGDYALLDFGALSVIAEAGYRELREPIAAWWAARTAGEVRSRGTPP